MRSSLSWQPLYDNLMIKKTPSNLTCFRKLLLSENPLLLTLNDPSSFALLIPKAKQGPPDVPEDELGSFRGSKKSHLNKSICQSEPV